jgi:hypothetical protein
VTKQFFSDGEQINGVNYYYQKDHLGTIWSMTDGSGTMHGPYNVHISCPSAPPLPLPAMLTVPPQINYTAPAAQGSFDQSSQNAPPGDKSNSLSHGEL